MDSILDLEKLFHRTKDRVKDLGEVFTPESYVEGMLDLLSKEQRTLWSNEDISFFEPCCGHGNIVIAIYKRRLEGIYKKIAAQGVFKNNEAPFYAVANTLNTLWAIDIDLKNVENCRSRVLLETLNFLKRKLEIKNDAFLVSKKKDFFAHILSAIKWHIDENETISAMSDPDVAKASASLTVTGAKWFSKNGHRAMNFNLTWVSFYTSCENSKVIPIEYERSLRFLDSILSRKPKGFEDYEFAKVVFEAKEPQRNTSKATRSISIGV